MTGEPIIETLGLTRRFGDIVAVSELELIVPARCVYGFLGPNGAGKTTTIRMLLGLISPDAGDVHLFGRPFTHRDWPILCKVGALVEAPSLYQHLTGRENLEVTRRLIDAPRERIERVLETVKLSDAADQRVRGYSTGMRQRLGLALALLNDPQLLILDEPTNGLDPAGIQEMRTLLRRLPETYGVTIFLSSHLLSEVELVASHIGIINKGTLLFQGELAELRRRVSRLLCIGSDRLGETREALQAAGWDARLDEGHLQMPVSGPEDAAGINRLLIEQGFQVHELHLRQPTLEEIFFHLTRAA